MKTKTLKKNKVNVVTLGCSKNIFDSEVMMAQLKANKFDVEHEAQQDDSEIVIINTCGFIDNAKQESIDTILRYSDAKEAGLVDKVYVTGCLSERYKDDLKTEIPNVDGYFGLAHQTFLLQKTNRHSLNQPFQLCFDLIDLIQQLSFLRLVLSWYLHVEQLGRSNLLS